MKNRLLIIIFLFLNILRIAGQQPMFTEATVTLPQIAYSASSWGDYDHDGDLDLALTGAEGNNPLTKIFRNDNGVYTDIQAALLPLHFGSVEWGDFDRDGDLDLLITGIETNGTSHTILYKNNQGTFTDSGVSLPGIVDGQAIWGDFNNDGLADILLTGNGLTRVYKNEDNDQFSEVNAALPNVETSMCSWNDFNNDGQPDIMVCGNTGGGMVSKLYRNNNLGQFSEETILPDPFYGLYGGQVRWCDLDGDGDEDFVLAGTDLYVDGYFLIYRNDGNRHFTRFDMNGAALLNPMFDLGDYDADGLTDIALIGTTPGCGGPAVTIIMKNQGDFNFSIISSLLPGFKLGSVNWGDFNNDGHADLIFTGLDLFDSPKTSIYLNNLGNPATFTINTPPTKPYGLSALTTSSKVTLYWHKSTDNQTPTGAITYNLSVGRSPDSHDILSPVASLTDGTHFLSAAGNSGTDTSWVISGLAPGTYYFSVQAIDNGFMPGNFSEYQSFEYAPVGMDETASINLSVSPNPSDNLLTIQGKPGQPLPDSIQIRNVFGNIVYCGPTPLTLDISQWPAGIYFLHPGIPFNSKGIKIVKL